MSFNPHQRQAIQLTGQWCWTWAWWTPPLWSYLRCSHVSWNLFWRDYPDILFRSWSTLTSLTLSDCKYSCFQTSASLHLSHFSCWPFMVQVISGSCISLFSLPFGFPHECTVLRLAPILNLQMTRVGSVQEGYWYPYLTKQVTFKTSCNTTCFIWQPLLLLIWYLCLSAVFCFGLRTWVGRIVTNQWQCQAQHSLNFYMGLLSSLSNRESNSHKWKPLFPWRAQRLGITANAEVMMGKKPLRAS